MPKTIADYPDAVQRITNANVDPEATTQAEVRQQLREADAPQITAKIVDELAGAVVTEERVLAAIEASGELPSEEELDSFAAVSDDYDQGDRVAAVADAVSDRVATIEDVRTAVDSAQSTDGPTFREDVERAVDSVASQRDFVGESPDEVTAEQAREIGAPSETAFRGAAARTIASADQVTPSDVVEGTEAKTPVSVIRDESGDAIAATGGPREELGREVADEIGADYMSTDEVEQQLNTEGTGERVSLTLRGRKVGEVDVE